MSRVTCPNVENPEIKADQFWAFLTFWQKNIPELVTRVSTYDSTVYNFTKKIVVRLKLLIQPNKGI